MESEFERQMGEICTTLQKHPLLTIEGDTTAESVELLLSAYKAALHDAINRPMGVVPSSADDLYDQTYYGNLS